VDKDRHTIKLFWDEYMANILALMNEDKKAAAVVMNKVSELLLLGRSHSVRLIATMQPSGCDCVSSGKPLKLWCGGSGCGYQEYL
jgi:hypothetical protein